MLLKLQVQWKINNNLKNILKINKIDFIHHRFIDYYVATLYPGNYLPIILI